MPWEKECAYFHGHPALVNKFFSSGVARDWFDHSVNVRPVSSREAMGGRITKIGIWELTHAFDVRFC